MSISQRNSHTSTSRLPDQGQTRPSNVVLIDQNRREEALGRLLAVNGVAEQSQIMRFLDFSKNNGIRLDAMWSLHDDISRLTHTVLAVPSAGRTAMFFASRPVDDRDAAAIAALIDHAARCVSTQDIHLAQVLLDPSDSLDYSAYRGGGFSELAKLSYMERPLGLKHRHHVEWPETVELVTFDESLESELLGILDASYEDTMDCPELRGLRQTQDILAGHRSTGEFDPTLWTIMRLDGQPAGAILLNPSPKQRTVELVYIGLAQHARGRGLGKRLLVEGLSRIAHRRERSVSLAVDDRNHPAIAMYCEVGFRRVLRRIAMIRPLRQVAEHATS